MGFFEAPDFDDHEQIHFVNEPSVGLRAIIAIHSTRRGPALGGCRMWAYQREEDAIRDALRLSRGMTYKAAMAGVRLGGGKSVIWGNARDAKSLQLLHAMGRFIDMLQGKYIVGEDIGTNPLDMKEIRSQTRFVSCLRIDDGGYGDPAPMTALGVLSAMRAGIKHRVDADGLRGIHVAVQGLGNVGRELCRLLAGEGARLTVCDVHEPSVTRVVEEFGARSVSPESIYDVEAEVFAPCAMGGILNRNTVPRLKVRVIAGAANNQLETADLAQALGSAAITYVPDYVANGGGLISCAAEWYREDAAQIRSRVLRIYDTSLEILSRAAAMHADTNGVADTIARERLSGL